MIQTVHVSTDASKVSVVDVEAITKERLVTILLHVGKHDEATSKIRQSFEALGDFVEILDLRLS